MQSGLWLELSWREVMQGAGEGLSQPLEVLGAELVMEGPQGPPRVRGERGAPCIAHLRLTPLQRRRGCFLMARTCGPPGCGISRWSIPEKPVGKSEREAGWAGAAGKPPQ